MLKWYGHVREEHYVGWRAMELKYRGEGRHTKRWLDKVTDDIKYKGLPADEVCAPDRATWWRIPTYIDPT